MLISDTRWEKVASPEQIQVWDETNHGLDWRYCGTKQIQLAAMVYPLMTLK